MRNPLSQNADRSLRDELIAIIEDSDVEFDGGLTDHTSLIKSGKLDSLGLFNVASFIERQIGPKLDLTSFDIAREWDTIADIINFIAKHRTAG